MRQPKTPGANGNGKRSVLSAVLSLLTVGALLLVAYWSDQPVFYLTALFAAVVYAAELLAGYHLRAASIAVQVGRTGMIATLLYAAFQLFSG